MSVVSAAMYKASRIITGSAFDTEIDAAILSAQSFVEGHTGRSLVSAERTQYFELPSWWNGFIQLLSPPVTAIGSVAIASGPNDWRVLTTEQYEVRNLASGRLFVRPSCIGRGLDDSRIHLGPAARINTERKADEVRVVYTGGYAAGALEAKLLEPFYTIIDAIRADRGSFQFALSDGFSGYTKTNRTADDRAMTIRHLCKPFEVNVL